MFFGLLQEKREKMQQVDSKVEIGDACTSKPLITPDLDTVKDLLVKLIESLTFEKISGMVSIRKGRVSFLSQLIEIQ